MKWEICDNCEGEGKHSKHLGAFTSSDLAEWSDDELEDYLAGFYDCVCSVCGGSGKVRAGSNRVEQHYQTDEEYFHRREGGY